MGVTREVSSFWKFWKMLFHSPLEVAENSNRTTAPFISDWNLSFRNYQQCWPQQWHCSFFLEGPRNLWYGPLVLLKGCRKNFLDPWRLFNSYEIMVFFSRAHQTMLSYLLRYSAVLVFRQFTEKLTEGQGFIGTSPGWTECRCQGYH